MRCVTVTAFLVVVACAPSAVLAKDRAKPAGPIYYVDAARGADSNDGSLKSPWKTIEHSLTVLKAGDTLWLRGGVYRESVRVSLRGRAKAPITLGSFPGERAIVDAGWAEFLDNPAEAWEPFPKGGKDAYRSRKRYANQRTVMGWFADTMIGLHTYYHAQDLHAANEYWLPAADKNSDIPAVYCGPGLWHDSATGHIHVRLAHTHLPRGLNYEGETDPRKVPMVITAFRTTTLHVDRAEHVRFQDLVIRGGGYETIAMDQASNIEFDNVAIYCGSYGMRITGTRKLSVVDCRFQGSVPPWCFRGETSLRTYPGRPHRDITRLGTHALLVPEAGREFSVYALPFNDAWEIAHCEFGRAHDGVYIGGVNCRFHHNKIYDLQDDGIYLSPMYSNYGMFKPEVHVYENLFAKCLTPLAFGGPEKANFDTAYIYRNIFDMREEIRTGRPRGKGEPEGTSTGQIMGDHGSPPWSAMKIYHNTAVLANRSRSATMGFWGAATPERQRFVFNNLFVHEQGVPAFNPLKPGLGQTDGNLFWSPKLDAKTATSYFSRYRKSKDFEASKATNAPGFASHSLFADPELGQLGKGVGQVTLSRGSPAVNAGVALPKEWPDPMRAQDTGPPDIGALPLGVAPPAFGPRE